MKFQDGHADIDFSYAQEITEKITKKILMDGLPDGVDFLNVNVPSKPVNDEIRFTELGKRLYNIHIRERHDPRGRPYYWIDGDPNI